MSIDHPSTAASNAPSVSATRRVWDLPVRVFHWTLALAMIGAYVTNRMGVEYFKYHACCGYAVIVLVSFRILWGIVGTRHARFWNFVRGPVTTLRYTWNTLRGAEPDYAGHNPLGALMVVALLLALFAQALTGLFANDDIFNAGGLVGCVSAELSTRLTTLHRQLFYWIAAAAGIHALAVIAHRIFRKTDLVRAMLTGRKPAHIVPPHEEIRSSRIGLAVLIALALCAVLTWILKHAPAASSPLAY